MPATAILLLAAGSSSRLGRPKQLLRYRDGTLLRHAAQTALAAALGPVIVVLGSGEPECREALLGLPITMVLNLQWDEGMGTSIATGMQCVREAEHDAVIITLCDQPAITACMLRALVRHPHDAGCSIVASRHGDNRIVDPPVLFTAQHFAQLRLLKGHDGAKAIIRQRPAEELGFVPCPEAAFDVDTEQDVAALNHR
ncbi:nucleotidyltransferase family protein [Verrucomicrobium sp. BvORR106]|uniref:nucleotidyltransferase family protein n=1 Tax=Verrucomicrobium sp. BvORR106 TaxID=1403819 RepID=UPI00056FF8E6|nr:nucleotidyltransferase family protein [Verrucomicrobium sp. BvORR106]